jgi:hypothetical protein
MQTFDLSNLALVREFRLGGAAPAIGWLGASRLVGVTQTGGSGFVADPGNGLFERKRGSAGPPCVDPPGKAVTERQLVFLMGATLNVMDQRARNRPVRLRGMASECGRLGLVVDRRREIAYIVGIGPEVAQVNLRTMRVSYRRVGGTRATRVDETHTELFGRRQLAAAHVDSRRKPRGVELIDLGDRRRRMVDSRAGGIAVAADRLLTYAGDSNGPAKGLRAYDESGRLRFRLSTDAVVHDVEVSGRHAYALTSAGLRVIDVRAGKVVSRSAFDPRVEVHFVRSDRAGE